MKIQWPTWTQTARTAIFRIASRNRGSSVRLGNAVFRLDESLRRYVITNDDGLLNALNANLKPGDVFFDVGANIGLYSLTAARRVGPEGKVFAFEPDPTNFALLSRNVQLNRLEAVIQPIQIALSDHVDDRGVLFYVPVRGGGSPESSLVAKGNNSRAVTLPVDTVDNFCTVNGICPTLIKIDTEGAEWPIIQGSLSYIRRARPRLIVEYHGSKTNDFGYTVAELWRQIEEMGYTQSYIMQGDKEYFMTLCIPR